MDLGDIPTGIRTSGAYLTFDPSKAQKGSPDMPHKIIVFGHRAASGTVAMNVPAQMLEASDAVAAWGVNSILAPMIAALKKNNPDTECWAIAQPVNGAGVKAGGSDTFSGSPTADCTFFSYIGGVKVEALFTASMTAAQMATAWIAAVNAADVPINAIVDGAVAAKVNYAALFAGLYGNDIDIRRTYYDGETVPDGITATLVAMNGGTTAPDLTASITALGDDWFDTWVIPYNDTASINAISAELTRRFGPTVEREGHAFHASRGSLSQLGTIGNSYNTPHPTMIDAGGMPTNTFEVAAAFAGTVAKYSAINPSLALSGRPVLGVLPPVRGARRSFTDRNTLLHEGISTYKVDDGGNVVIDRMISMYRQNPAGVTDDAYLMVERMYQLFRWRWLMRVRMVTKFANFGMASDDTKVPPGEPIIQPKTYKLELISLAREQEGKLVQNVDDYAARLQVEIDPDNAGQMNSLQNPTFIDPLFVQAGRIQFA